MSARIILTESMMLNNNNLLNRIAMKYNSSYFVSFWIQKNIVCIPYCIKKQKFTTTSSCL